MRNQRICRIFYCWRLEINTRLVPGFLGLQDLGYILKHSPKERFFLCLIQGLLNYEKFRTKGAAKPRILD